MKFSKTRLAVAAAVLAMAVPGYLFLDYVLPHQEVVRINEASSRRSDNFGAGRAGRDAAGTGSRDSRDVYQIFAEDIVTKQAHVYHNEDSVWYLKWNSGDVQGDAISISRDQEKTALVTYVHWRSNFFSWFPNVLAIKRVPADYKPFPWFAVYLLLTLSLILAPVAWVASRVRRRIRRRAAAPLA